MAPGRRIQWQRGQGLTEYIIIVALIAVAAIAVYQYFGQTVRNQTAAIATEIAGKDGGTAKSAAQTASVDVQTGRQNVIHGFTRITNGDNINEISVRGIKEHLAKNAPVAIGMMVGQSFMQSMMGQELWEPSGMDASQMGMGGHAMCVIGYDDRKFGGAFQIMNSWGPEWGKNGVAWVRYGDFKNYVRDAYGIDPLPIRSNVANIPLECNIGLVKNDDKQNIALRVAGGIISNCNTNQSWHPV